MYNTPASTGLRRDSKPSPPQRSDTKKQNIMSSPTFQSQADHHSSQAGISTSIKAAVDSPTTLTLHPSDLSSLLIQLKQALKDEISETITETIRSCLKHEIESCVKEATHFLIQEMDSLKVENSKLKGDIDALEQYSRRELISMNHQAKTLRTLLQTL